MRAGGLVAVSVAAAIALTSCSLVQVAPSPVVTSSPRSTALTDPSIPAPTASAPDSPAPVPSGTSTATPVPTPSPSISRGTRTAVTPFVTAASWDQPSGTLTVTALVPNLVELDGTCTVTATNGSTTLSASATSAPGANDTECNPMTLAGSRLTAGTWSLVVAYSSKRSVGVSAAHTVAVTR